MIKKTIRLLRKQLKSKVVILLDGVKPEQEYLRADYEQYKKDLEKWVANQADILTIEFADFQHQSGMMRKLFTEWEHVIPTTQLLFIEHDFPVVGDIPWADIHEIIRNGQADLVRFYLETKLIPEHRHMFMEGTPILVGNVPVLRTGQWSQRPHIASKALYRIIVRDMLKGDRKTYIEDMVHGYFAGAFDASQKSGWDQYKLCVYHPEGIISRCEHLDGRLGEAKYGL
jgi:hypothetical protein